MSRALNNAGDPAPSGFLSSISDRTRFRNYAADSRASVKELYRLNHASQTIDFVRSKIAEYSRLNRAEMGIWEAMEFLNTLVDDSDPDIDLTQMDHALQTAEAIRMDGHPRWLVLAGLIHDLGKVLCLFGEPQWAVVGDTFPVGCAWSYKIVYREFFEANPDTRDPQLQTQNGIYEEHCGLENVLLSWGHDQYLYEVVRKYVPREAGWVIRYHSCYPIHRDHAYTHLLGDQDEELLKCVRAFNPYDLYSKCDVKPNLEELKPFYQELISEFFPPKIRW